MPLVRLPEFGNELVHVSDGYIRPGTKDWLVVEQYWCSSFYECECEDICDEDEMNDCEIRNDYIMKIQEGMM